MRFLERWARLITWSKPQETRLWPRFASGEPTGGCESFFDIRFWGAFLVSRHGKQTDSPARVKSYLPSSTVPPGDGPSGRFLPSRRASPAAVEAFAAAMAVEHGTCARRMSWHRHCGARQSGTGYQMNNARRFSRERRCFGQFGKGA